MNYFSSSLTHILIIKLNECVIAVQYMFVFLKEFITILFNYFFLLSSSLEYQ